MLGRLRHASHGSVIALFDQDLIDRRRRRAWRNGDPPAFLLEAAVDDLADRLAAIRRHFALAVDLATPAPLLAARLAADGQAGQVIRIDRLAARDRAGPAARLAADAEALPLAAASVDLIASALALHLADDLPGVLAQARAALRPDGLFFASLLGGDTLGELRLALAIAESELRGGAAPRVAPFASLQDLGALLQRAGFALPVADRDVLVVRYPTALELMADLRAMGCANALLARDRRPLTRRFIARTAEVYAERFGDADGKVRATFEIVSLSGWAPHASQQKPLRPGSAETSLAAALNARKV